jgi:addiction module HigA family antidote
MYTSVISRILDSVLGLEPLAREVAMQRMFNPPHPGKILRDALGDMDVTTAARKLHVSRTTLPRILNGAAGISAEMFLRLSAALGTHDSLWYELQMSYDIWKASRRRRPNIERLEMAA